MIELFGFFLIGLTGGFGHCILMCHPFVLFISSKFGLTKKGYLILVPHIFYNLGRILTYSVFGAIAGFLGNVAQYAGAFTGIQKLSSIIGGIVLICFAIFSLYGHSYSSSLLSKFKFYQYFHNKIQINNPFFLGIMLGFLPCGLSMGAVIGSASSGSALIGALLLFSFGIGTSVSLVLTAIFGTFAMKYSNILKKAGSILLFCMGIYFIYMGISY